MRISDEALSYAKVMDFNEQIIPIYWRQEWYYLYEVRDAENITLAPMRTEHFFGSIEQKYMPVSDYVLVQATQVDHSDMQKFLYYYIDFSLRFPEYFVKKKYLVHSGNKNRYIVVATTF